MNTQKKDGRREKAKSNTFGPMGHGMSEMMTKCCTGQGSFPDCLTMMEEMKKQCCGPHKDAAESERKKK
jgi:pentatricopeptide repeat protein